MKKIFIHIFSYINTVGIMPTLLVLVLMLGISNLSHAQLAVAFGPKVGVSAYTFKGVDADNVEDRTTLMGGLFFNLQLGSAFLVQPELLINEKGAVQTKDNIRNDISVTYFEVPVLAKFRIPLGVAYPHVLIGPSFGFKTNAHYTSTNTSNGNDMHASVDDIRKSDVGGVVGAGIDFQSKGSGLFFTTDARYGVSFTNITSNDAQTSIDMHNTGWTISAGIGLKLGGSGD